MSLTFPDFPLEDTVGGGLYQPDQEYLGNGLDEIYFGHSPSRPGERYLITFAPDSGLDLDRVRPLLMPDVPWFFEPLFVGHFDAIGDDDARDQLRTTTAAFVERLPEGGPLHSLVEDRRPWAVTLGQQVGRILLESYDAQGPKLTGLRPEFVWVKLDQPGAEPVVTGLGGRNMIFLSNATRKRDLPTAPLFKQKYFAPEVYKGEPSDDRALVLTLAVMVAEWATGEYPYAMDQRWGFSNLSAGRHRALDLPTPLAELLAKGMRPNAADRPPLGAFVYQLTRLRGMANNAR